MTQPKENDEIETPDHCTKAYNQVCRLHPVDCPTCKNEPTCGMKTDMQAHPDKIKSCRHYRRKPAVQQTF